MQVTADGVPVIWHDDLVLRLPQQPNSAAQIHRICELNLREFKKLSQHSPSSRDTSNSSSSNNKATACSSQSPSSLSDSTHCSSQSAQLTDAATQQAQCEQSSASAYSAADALGVKLARYFSSEQGKRMHSAQAWSVSEEDSLPTLAEVFKVCLALLSISVPHYLCA